MLEVLRLAETGYEGQYIINTADAYRGCAVYFTGVKDATAGSYYCNLPATTAQARLVDGLVTTYSLLDTGSDTADAVDKLTKGSRVVVCKGDGLFKVSGNAVVSTSWATQYWLGDNLATAAQHITTAVGKHAFVGLVSGELGRWSATAADGFGAAGRQDATASQIWGPQVRVLNVVGSTAKGVEITIDVDWNRRGVVAGTHPV